MANPYYERSYRFECKEVEHWIARGYYAFRSYASKGPYDVIAFNTEEVVLIALTVFTDRRNSSKAKKDTARLQQIPKSARLRMLQVERGPVRKGVETPRVEVEV
jgi:hypothetical protein